MLLLSTTIRKPSSPAPSVALRDCIIVGLGTPTYTWNMFFASAKFASEKKGSALFPYLRHLQSLGVPVIALLSCGTPFTILKTFRRYFETYYQATDQPPPYAEFSKDLLSPLIHALHVLTYTA